MTILNRLDQWKESGASLAWGLSRRQFSFVAYAAVYGYIGISAVLIRDINDTTALLSYFVLRESPCSRCWS